jgi:hypothetical protein
VFDRKINQLLEHLYWIQNTQITLKNQKKNMYFKKFNQYMLNYVIIYDLVLLFVIPVTLLFFFVQKNPRNKFLLPNVSFLLSKCHSCYLVQFQSIVIYLNYMMLIYYKKKYWVWLCWITISLFMITQSNSIFFFIIDEHHII